MRAVVGGRLAPRATHGKRNQFVYGGAAAEASTRFPLGRLGPPSSLPCVRVHEGLDAPLARFIHSSRFLAHHGNNPSGETSKEVECRGAVDS